MLGVQLSTRKRDIMAFSGFVYEDDMVRSQHLAVSLLTRLISSRNVHSLAVDFPRHYKAHEPDSTDLNIIITHEMAARLTACALAGAWQVQ